MVMSQNIDPDGCYVVGSALTVMEGTETEMLGAMTVDATDLICCGG